MVVSPRSLVVEVSFAVPRNDNPHSRRDAVFVVALLAMWVAAVLLAAGLPL